MSKYNLVGIDGNAFSILGYVVNAMKKEKCSSEEIKEYEDKATSDDYDNLLRESILIIEKMNEKHIFASNVGD